MINYLNAYKGIVMQLNKQVQNGLKDLI